MISTILSVLCALLILTFFITIHEFGHFIVGKLFRFKINEFAIGMGPKILKHQGKETLFSIRAFPIGGMCIFDGEDEEIENEDSFRSHNVWHRILVVIAGPLFNILMAVILSAVSLSVFGKYLPKIESIDSQDCPAYINHLKENDIVTKINGKNIIYFNQLSEAVTEAKDTLDLTVLRDGNEKEFKIEDLFDTEKGKNYLGIRINSVQSEVPVIESLGQSFEYVYIIASETFKSLAKIFKGNIDEAGITGPVGTVAYASKAVQYGIESVLSFAILISASLGIMNLLPFPALDGGRLLFMIIEAITGKPVDPKKEGLVHFVGIVLLLLLIVFVSFKDITKLFNGEMFR